MTGIVGPRRLGRRARRRRRRSSSAPTGIRSTIADRVEAPVERRGTGASAVVYGYWRDLETDGYEWIFRPRAAAGVIPTNDGAGLRVRRRRHRPACGRGGTARAATASWPRPRPSLPARVDAAGAADGVRTFTGRPGFIRRAWGPGWALVGDAGYWKDPLSAHGLTDALRDAELLARAIVAASDGDDG